MDKSGTAPPKSEKKGTRTKSPILSDFMSAFYRLFKVGIYYPEGHAVFDQATKRFQTILRNIADKNRSILLELKDESLFLLGIELDPETIFVNELKNIFTTLGIQGVEIDREITGRELQQFMSGLLMARSRLQGKKGFSQVSIDNLPLSVRVKQKEYSISENAIVKSNGEESNIGALAEALQQHGLSSEQIQQCCKLIGSLPEKIDLDHTELAILPHVTWHDIEQLFIRAFGQKKQKISGQPWDDVSQIDINTIASMFSALEKKTEDQKSKETIHLMLSLMTANPEEPIPGSVVNKNIIKFRQSKFDARISVAELQEFVDNNRIHQEILAKITEVDQSEELSILLQFIRHEHALSTRIKVQQILRDILTTQLNKKEWQVLVRGSQQLLHNAEPRQLHEAFSIILVALRNAKDGNPLFFLLSVCQGIANKKLSLIWPFIVNELMLNGSNIDSKSYNSLCEIVLHLPFTSLRGSLKDLEEFECCQEKKIAADIFHSVPKATFPLFGLLLETSAREKIATRILTGLRQRESPDWLGEAIIPLLDVAQTEHLKFLHSYLIHATKQDPPVKVRTAGGKILVDNLHGLSQEQRTEDWVIKAITAAPRMQIEQTAGILNKIANEKKLLFLPGWPADCRQAAAEAIKALKRAPLYYIS